MAQNVLQVRWVFLLYDDEKMQDTFKNVHDEIKYLQIITEVEIRSKSSNMWLSIASTLRHRLMNYIVNIFKLLIKNKLGY